MPFAWLSRHAFDWVFVPRRYAILQGRRQVLFICWFYPREFFLHFSLSFGRSRPRSPWRVVFASRIDPTQFYVTLHPVRAIKRLTWSPEQLPRPILPAYARRPRRSKWFRAEKDRVIPKASFPAEPVLLSRPLRGSVGRLYRAHV